MKIVTNLLEFNDRIENQFPHGDRNVLVVLESPALACVRVEVLARGEDDCGLVGFGVGCLIGL
mgnify:CR=1 FL=1